MRPPLNAARLAAPYVASAPYAALTAQRVGTPPAMSLAVSPALLPTCAAGGNAVGLAVAAGAIAIGAQLLLVKLFRASGDRVLTATPGQLVHKLVALTFMVLAGGIGAAAWLHPALAGGSAGLLTVNATTRWLAAVLLGELLLWDIPSAVWIPALRRKDMLLHHVGMAVVAYLAVSAVPMAYGLFYLGFSELSTIPLQVNEIYALAHKNAPDDDQRKPAFAKLRDVFQVAAAGAFVYVRGWSFTRVTVTKFLPDVVAYVSSTMPTLLPKGPLVAMLGLGVGFNALQLYWLWLLIAYMAKNGPGGERPE